MGRCREPMRSEALPERHEEALSALVEKMVSGELAGRMTSAQRAQAAWFAANGDRERAHTTRVFLRASRVASAAPVMVVYVDSHALVTDLSANRDLYLARLANQGYAVSGVEFAVDRQATRQVPSTSLPHRFDAPADASPSAPAEVPAELIAMLDELTPALREKVSKALDASFSNQGKKITVGE